MSTLYVLETLTRQQEAAVRQRARVFAARRPVVTSTRGPERAVGATSWRRSLRLVLQHG
jgi:hypothetical protein